MARPYGRGEQRDRLLREALAELEALSRRQRHVAGAKLFGLFAIDRSPLSLMAD